MVLLPLWPAAFFAYAAPPQNTRVLAPPKSALVPVHFPDLTPLEADVRQQLKSLEDSLVAVVADQSSDDAKLSEAYGEQGEIYHAYSLYAPARECYVNANRLAPKDFRWIYLLAKLDQLDGNADEAIRRYRAAAALRPDYVAVHVSLGNLFLELNRLQDAKLSFAAALKIHEQSPAAYYGLGQVALSSRSYGEALEYFKRALALAPEANRIHYSLAMAYRGLTDPDNARTHLAQQGSVGVRAADPLVDGLQELITGERVYIIRGRLAFEAKRYAEAADEFRKAIASRPESVAAHVNLGAALTQTGDLKSAAEQFEETLRIDPNNTTAHYNLAALFAKENKHEQAVVHLQAIAKTNPNDLEARFLLGQELTKMGRIDEALDEFTRIVQPDLDNEETLIAHVKRVGVALAELGRCKEAAEWQRGIIAEVQQDRKDILLARLRADFERYKRPPCRPLGDDH